MHAPTPATPRKPEELPDHDAQLRLFAAALAGASAFGIDPKDHPDLFVCYEALRRLFYGGRTGRSAVTVILQDAAWADTSRAPDRKKLKKALRAFQLAAADVIAELPPEARPARARALGLAVDTKKTRGTCAVPLVAAEPLPLAA